MSNDARVPREGGDEADFIRCPHCGLPFELTWRRYFGAPWGHHSCPFCQARFRLRRSPGSLALTVAATIAVEGGAFALALLFLPLAVAAPIPLLLGLFVVLPLDKRLDARHGQPTPLDPERRPPL